MDEASRRTFLGSLAALAITHASTLRASEADDTFRDVEEKLRPTATKLGSPRPGDWLAEHEEAGQSFDEYLRSRPVRKSDRLTTIYISTLGVIPEDQKSTFDLVAEYLAIFFAAPVKKHKHWDLDRVASEAQRINEATNQKQVLTTFVLEELLKPTRPNDALAYLALTAVDLWPGMGWNFVFGQGSLRERTGVWSTARNGNPAGSSDERGQFLRRTLATASHETMHLLSMPHCKEFECVLNGSNNLRESDRKPLRPCPTCERKLSWNLMQSPAERFDKLASFCRRHGLRGDEESFGIARRALEQKGER